MEVLLYLANDVRHFSGHFHDRIFTIKVFIREAKVIHTVLKAPQNVIQTTSEVALAKRGKTRRCWCCCLVPGPHHHPRQILPFIINWKNERRREMTRFHLPWAREFHISGKGKAAAREQRTTKAPCFAAVVDSGGAERRQDRVSRAKWDTVRRSSITCWSSD